MGGTFSWILGLDIISCVHLSQVFLPCLSFLFSRLIVYYFCLFARISLGLSFAYSLPTTT